MSFGNSRCNKRFAFRVAAAIVGLTLVLFGIYQRGEITDHLQGSWEAVGVHGTLKGSLGNKQSPQTCKEKIHVAFLKVPKAGSSTVQNIFFRFGTLRWLTFALPVYANYIGRKSRISDRAIIPPPQGKHYDILCNHVMYSRFEFSRILQKDAMYIGIIREPLPQLESYIYYYHQFDIPGDDKLTEFLQNPYPYILTKNIPPNPQTQYYGLDDEDRTDSVAIRKFITRINKEFDFIIILERLDESLLLLKRLLCWQLTDILYIRKNTNYYNPRRARSHPQRTKHKGLALAEYLFYDRFLSRLISAIVKEGSDFQHELDFYRNTLSSVKSFCLDKRRRWSDQFYIPASKWNAETNVSAAVCHVMLLPELQLLDLVGKRQYGEEQWRKVHPYIPVRHRQDTNKVLETKTNVTLSNGKRVQKIYYNFKNQRDLSPNMHRP